MSGDSGTSLARSNEKGSPDRPHDGQGELGDASDKVPPKLSASRNAFSRFNAMVDYGFRRLSKSKALALVWLVLLRHADGEGYTFVSAQTIATKLGIKDARTVKAYLAKLRAAGYVTAAKPRPGYGTRRYRRVLLPASIAPPVLKSPPSDVGQLPPGPMGSVRQAGGEGTADAVGVPATRTTQ